MADNQPVSNLPLTALTPRSIDKGGNLYQVVVIDQGGAGAEDLVTSTNPFVVSTSIPTSLKEGRQVISVTNTAVQLTAVSSSCKRIDIKAIASNTQDIVIGSSSVNFTLATRTGFAISAGESYHIEIDDPSKVYINGTAGEGVTYTIFT